MACKCESDVLPYHDNLEAEMVASSLRRYFYNSNPYNLAYYSVFLTVSSIFSPNVPIPFLDMWALRIKRGCMVAQKYFQ